MSSTENPSETGPHGARQAPPSKVPRAVTTFSETFGLTPAAAFGLILFVVIIVIAAVFWFFYSAPPRTLIMTAGPPGSSYERIAEEYRSNLLTHGVTVKILPSEGSLENLQRLGKKSFHVDIGFVQDGETDGSNDIKLYSLGSVAFQPLMIFYRSATPVHLLADLAGKRLAIGPAGSGAHMVAMTLLATNGISPGGATKLLDLEGESAAKALLDGQVDAVFAMGDSTPLSTMRTLLHTPGIELFDFVQADAYSRRITYLNKLVMPRGAMDFAADLPSHDVTLLAPTVELVARADLHPALSDVLLDAATKIHKRASLFQHRGEFPADLGTSFPISPDAKDYLLTRKKKGFYRWLPFGLASVVTAVVVSFGPMLLVLIPGLKLIPKAYKWRIQLSIYRWYRSLLKVEHELVGKVSAAKHDELQHRLDDIERAVKAMKVPASFASQFFGLREHIDAVRERLAEP